MVRLLVFAIGASLVTALVAVGCGTAEQCGGRQDEDGDGRVDCFDSDCWLAGGACAELCTSLFDEDGDGAIGCADSDCWLAGGVCPERCDGESDEDGDGAVGCADSDCWVTGLCSEICSAAGDEDGDGATDCADSDCWTAAAGCPERCEGGGDEDGDGLVDCDDSECLDAFACAPSYGEEVRPILLEHCAGQSGACHSAESALGGLSVESYDDLPKGSIYCPGETKGWCALFRILEPSMPQDCLGCVPADDIAILERWVAAGIPE